MAESNNRKVGGSAGTVLSLAAAVFLENNPTWGAAHPRVVLALYALATVLCIYTALQWPSVQRLIGIGNHMSETSHGQSSSATATTGSVNVTVNSQPQPSAGEIAKAVVKHLKEEEKASDNPALSPGDGFVQLEDSKTELLIPSMPLRVGDRFSLKYWFSNRGGLPVYDVQTWGILHILVPGLNPPGNLKRVMLEGVKQGHQEFPDSGSTLGVGAELHGIAVIAEPLTKEQIDGVRDGSLALFFVMGGVWKDNKREFHYWVDGRVAQISNFPNLDGFSWRGL
jgi:hypothetical protein